MNNLIKKLETHRLENKISQEELAKNLGVAFSTVNRWLNGKSKPNKIMSVIKNAFKSTGVEHMKTTTTKRLRAYFTTPRSATLLEQDRDRKIATLNALILRNILINRS